MALPRGSHRIALALVEALEPSGWLGLSTAAIAADLALPEAEVTAVLTRLQTVDPAGLFARNLAECLALQAADLGLLDREMGVILHNLDLLAAGDLARLAALCGCDEAGVARRFRLIRALNPKPGSDFSPANPAHAREPDLVARPLKGGRWQVALNRSALPALEVVADPPKGSRPEGLQAARALHHMLAARNDTLLQVGREIARRQIGALAQGPGALAPMTMAEVAETLGLHVSTISRVVAGASLDSPHGVWWLRRMFSGARGAGKSGGDGPRAAAAALAPPAGQHCRHRIRRSAAVRCRAGRTAGAGNRRDACAPHRGAVSRGRGHSPRPPPPQGQAPRQTDDGPRLTGKTDWGD
jgi:RNA polymerase sigma-54 factor